MNEQKCISRLLQGPVTGLAPLCPNFQLKNQKICKRCRKRILSSILGHMGKVLFFEFFQNYTPPGGSTKKNILRLPTRSRAKSIVNFFQNPSCIFGSKSEQTNRQAGSLFYIFKIVHMWWLKKLWSELCSQPLKRITKIKTKREGIACAEKRNLFSLPFKKVINSPPLTILIFVTSLA